MCLKASILQGVVCWKRLKEKWLISEKILRLPREETQNNTEKNSIKNLSMILWQKNKMIGHPYKFWKNKQKGQ